jgi:glycerophosphoryl diester phosphodiesterase
MVGAGAPHPESVIRLAGGGQIELKVHQCVWSGAYVPNSLAAVLDCYRARVARAEIDVAILADEDFLVVHDLDLSRATDGSGFAEDTRRSDAEHLHLTNHGTPTDERVMTLSEVACVIAAEPYPTLVELDLKDWKPWPWPRVEELARILQPVKDRITFGGGADWNLRRLRAVDPSMPMGYTITSELDWVPATEKPGRLPGVRGAYGYLDAHPLASARVGSTRDYLLDRLGGILRLVPGARDIHVRLVAAERMVDDGLTDLADILHREGMLLDVWTLNASAPGWRQHLDRAIALGADVITSETPRELSRATSV